MRLKLSFTLLLITASTGSSLAWQEFGSAQSGDTLSRTVALAGASFALISLLLLSRIVLKVSERARER